MTLPSILIPDAVVSLLKVACPTVKLLGFSSCLLDGLDIGFLKVLDILNELGIRPNLLIFCGNGIVKCL